MLVAASVAVVEERNSFASSVNRIGVWPLLLSLVFAMAGVAGGYPVWWDVLLGLGARIPFWEGARVFFVSQLGKYVPGSVWPMLMQMEEGRARGIQRRTMLGSSMVTAVIGCCVGLVVACALLPFYDAQALGRYWWALVALPLLIAMLHPRAMPGLLDRAFGILRRPPLSQRLDGRYEARACLWSMLTWLGLGGHLAVLCLALGHGGISIVVLCIGAAALAIPVGILFLPAPAGAGVREVVLTLVLSTAMPTGQAFAIVVASRIILIVSELLLAGIATLIDRAAKGRRRSAPSHGGAVDSSAERALPGQGQA